MYMENEIQEGQTLDDVLSVKPKQGEDLPVILVDSDTICYRAASATDGRQYIVRNTAFKYKADIVKYCEREGIPIDEIDIEFFPEPLSHALSIVKGCVAKVKEYAQGKFPEYTMEFFHTGKTNFRNHVVDDYKANRKDTRKPYHLAECKGYVKKRFNEYQEEYLEADDLIGIRAYELREKGIPYVIVTNDKDLKTIPGCNYNWVKEEEINVSEVEAMKFFYAQCIAGDSTDNIPGVSGLSINNKGTGKAQKIIQQVHENLIEADPDIPLQEVEKHLYKAAINAWLEGGPGKKGSYGCKSLIEVYLDFEKSAQCLYILHERELRWQAPLFNWSNYK